MDYRLWGKHTWGDIGRRLSYAREYCDKSTYERIYKSYKKTLGYSVIFILLLLIGYTIMLVTQIPTMDKYASDNVRPGHVSGNTVWYIQNDKHEIKLTDYGYNETDFNDNEKFVVYLDKDNHVIGIAPDKIAKKERELPFVLMICGLFLMIVMILCIWTPISYKTFGKDFRTFNKWYRHANLDQDRFTYN